MSQFDYSLNANQTGNAYNTDVISALAAVNSLHKGSSRPPYAVAGMLWIDESSTPTWALKLYDGADDITVCNISTSGNNVTFSGLAKQDGSDVYATAGGTANAITVSPSPAFTAYTAGMAIRVLLTSTNTGATTINVNGLGLKNITKNGSTALSAGDLINNETVLLIYDGTQFQLLKYGSITPATISQTLAGTETSVFITPDNLAAIWERGTDIASGSTVAIPSTGGGYFQVTGTTGISGISQSSLKTGRRVRLTFTGVLTLTHGSNLILPGSANITTAAGDSAEFVAEATTPTWRCVQYTRASGRPMYECTQFISSTTISAGASEVALPSAFAAGFDKYHIDIINMTFSADNRPKLQYTTDGSTYINTNYDYGFVGWTSGATGDRHVGDVSIDLLGISGSSLIDSPSPSELNTTITVYSPGSSTPIYSQWSYGMIRQDASRAGHNCWGIQTASVSVVGFKLFPSTGTFQGGKVNVYGVRSN